MLAGLGREHTFCRVAVPLTLAVFLVGVLDGDFFIDKILTVHARNGIVGGFKVGEGDEAVAFWEVILVARNLVPIMFSHPLNFIDKCSPKGKMRHSLHFSPHAEPNEPLESTPSCQTD